MNRQTPWGLSDSYTRYTPEIVFYTTPSHGGFHVTGESLKKIPIKWRNASFNSQGTRGWFEEDCDWCMVALTFPGLLDAASQEAAQGAFEHWIKPKLAQS